MLCIIFSSIRAIGSYSVPNNRKVIKKTRMLSVPLKVTNPEEPASVSHSFVCN